MKGIIKLSYLFLDQATNISGAAIFLAPYKLKEYHLIDLSRMPKGTDQLQAEKRYEFIKQVREIVYRNNVNFISTEGIYGGKQNLKTYKLLAQIQASIQDWCRRSSITCFSWANAGEWRSYINIPTYENGQKLKSERLKELTKSYVLAHYDISDNLKFDIYDSIGMSDAYFKMLEQKGIT
jgi:hypothetical protein